MFAKLFEFPEIGQVLIMLDRDSEAQNPAVSIFIEPPGLGVCSIAYSFPDTDEGWDNAENFLDSFNPEKAEEFASNMLRYVG